ncbi:hypothetical protein [Natronoglomus mannanivorans]|uniref:DUF2064 domain-containing protein n=1 Tax=Natronoglomus mannanivorans TaxID=2979990 RepID=A0AAP2YWN1_9EURY|nr:hypothetical protein [Halobacteria archaeon AArc-xg1-1]
MIVVVPVDPPRDGLVLSSLAETTPLSLPDARRLYEAATADVVRTVVSSGGELLVNYRDEETLPMDDGVGDEETETDAETEVRTLVTDALGEDVLEAEDVRFERQVGSTRAARVGNTVTHLLEEEDHASVGVLEPTTPLVARTEIDGAAMTIRRNEVVLGPAPAGRVYFACFAEPIDFTDAYATPELGTLATHGADAGLNVGFAPMLPTVATEADLCSTIAGLEARRAAGRPVPEATAAVVDELGIVVEDGPTIVRG